MSDAPARRVLGVASRRGGVGKSMLALNLALTQRGAAVGVLDADLYGPDIPLMAAPDRRPVVRSQPWPSTSRRRSRKRYRPR